MSTPLPQATYAQERPSVVPLPVIQMFWHGLPLSRIERLSMISFLRNGHAVHLYVYDEPAGVPPGVVLKDAGEILPRSSLFFHRRNRSVAHFSDWFRYRLLFERGGLWSDADMICLKPFDYESPIVFAWQDEQHLNNAVLGLPARDPLAAWLARVSTILATSAAGCMSGLSRSSVTSLSSPK